MASGMLTGTAWPATSRDRPPTLRAMEVRGSRSATDIRRSIASAAAVAHGRPMVVAFPRKISENDSPTQAAMPQRLSACGACSRDEPDPKFSFTRRIDAPA